MRVTYKDNLKLNDFTVTVILKRDRGNSRDLKLLKAVGQAPTQDLPIGPLSPQLAPSLYLSYLTYYSIATSHRPTCTI